MRLVDDAQDAICTRRAKGDETTILDHEDTIVWVRDDSSLVLRDLDDDETKEGNNCVRN